jgi:hypothetical protein
MPIQDGVHFSDRAAAIIGNAPHERWMILS